VITAAIMALTITGIVKSTPVIVANEKFAEKNAENNAGAKGAKMPKPARPQAAKLMYDHKGRIILALGVAVKSAPRKPIERAMEPKAKSKNSPSRKPTTIKLTGGL